MNQSKNTATNKTLTIAKLLTDRNRFKFIMDSKRKAIIRQQAKS